MSTIPLTVTGAGKLRAELHEMKTVHRPAVIAAIAEARSHGDLSENAEYEAAKERQGFIEGRIAELESKLSNAQIIDPATLSGNRVIFGATVTLKDENDKNPPHVMVLSSGDVMPFELEIERESAPALWRVTGLADNDLRVENRDERQQWGPVRQTKPPLEAKGQQPTRVSSAR